MKKIFGVFAVLLVIFINGYTQPGQPDPSFGNNGKATPGGSEMAIQPDGKIVLASKTGYPYSPNSYDIYVTRLMPDGKVDASFGVNGSVVINYVPEDDVDPEWPTIGYGDEVHDIAIAPDGKIVIVGWTAAIEDGTRYEKYSLVVQLNSDGSRDATFDNDGIRAFNLGGDEFAEAVSVLQDGTILIAGALAKAPLAQPGGHLLDIMVMKLKPNGQFDEVFGSDGISLINLGERVIARDMVVQEDGKIILAGTYETDSPTSFDPALVRLLADGKPDRSFSEDGILTFNTNAQFGTINNIAIQEDQKIVFTGIHQLDNYSDRDIFVGRLNNDGSFDYGFNYGGIKIIGVSGTDEEGIAVLVDRRSNIIIGTQSSTLYDYRFAVLRLTPEGNLDTRFDEDGKIDIHMGFASMQFQTDGKLLLAGTGVLRLLYEPNPDLTSRATYIGPNILGTPCYGCQTAIIPLRATVTSYEDVRNVRVKFVDRDNNTDITGWITASKLIEPNDFSMATVDATWYVTLSYDQPVKKVRLGMVVDFGNAVRNNPADDEMITLYMPQNDVVSGGGELFVSATSKGKYKANEGTITMFGFYAQSKPGLSSPDGYMNMWYSGPNQSGMTVTYKLEIDAIKSLGVNNSAFRPRHAEFRGTGKLWQENGSTRILVEDNVTVQTKLVDGDDVQPNEDSLIVYIWSSNNTLIHTSNWFINEAVPQPLWRGQVNVHNGSAFDEASSEVITQRINGSARETINQKGFTVAVLNNPTRNEFVLNVKSTESNVYSIRITDLSGRVIETRNNLPISNTLRLGSKYKTGMFFAEIRQGKEVKTVRLVKH